MAAYVHLVRHAEVANPDGVVYGSLPGFGLSERGVEQARRVARYLGPRPVVAVWSSPLERALRTAEEIAARSGAPVHVDFALTETGLADRWAGHRWDALEKDFPGELESYLSDPMDISFSPESLDQVAGRVCTVIRRLEESHPHGDVVVVSHQDPIQAARLRLTGRRLTSFHEDKPPTAGVITLRPGAAWTEETSWAPDESPRGDGSQLRLITDAERGEEPPDTA